MPMWRSKWVGRCLLSCVLLSGCGGSLGSAESHASRSSGALCGGHPLPCGELPERFLEDAVEAPIVAMELERDCAEGRVAACGALAPFLLEGLEVDHDRERAAELFADACERGQDVHCLSAGQIYASTGSDDARALSAFEVACDADHGGGCLGLGELLYEGRGTRRDRERAVGVFRRGCELGDEASCRKVADHLVMTADRPSLLRFYEGLCSTDNHIGCGMLAFELQRNEGHHDRRRAGELFVRACSGGHDEACTVVALGRARGDLGLAPNREEAERLLEATCGAGDADACGELAELRDDSRLREESCRRRSGRACLSLGFEARDGADFVAAARFFRAACDTGTAPRGCGALGAAYERGRGVRENISEAVAFYHRACDGGHPDSCVRLALLLEEGDRVDRDGARASELRTRACELRPIDDHCRAQGSAGVIFQGYVQRAEGTRLRRGAACSANVSDRLEGGWCRLRVQCGGLPIYRGWAKCELESPELIRAWDWSVSRLDESPTLELDGSTGRLRVADYGRRVEVSARN